MVSVAKLVKASGCGPEDRGFESLRSPHHMYDFYAPVAQRIEHQSSELRVGGSNPFWRIFILLVFVSKIDAFRY